jgi:hypothetical protein
MNHIIFTNLMEIKKNLFFGLGFGDCHGPLPRDGDGFLKYNGIYAPQGKKDCFGGGQLQEMEQKEWSSYQTGDGYQNYYARFFNRKIIDFSFNGPNDDQ